MAKSRINDTVVPIALAVAGVAAIAVLFANKASSGSVIQSIGSAFFECARDCVCGNYGRFVHHKYKLPH